MSLSHNAEADFAASELARMFVGDPGLCYTPGRAPAGLSAAASYEPSSSPWPKADGVVSLLESAPARVRDIAVEYKRIQEGTHGLLTAIGQSQGYVHKGYSGSVIVVPETYPSHGSPGAYVASVLDSITGVPAIGVFEYSPPDTSSATPFAGRLTCLRRLQVDAVAASPRAVASGPKTQWVHMREGSTTRDAFYRFLQEAKRLSAADTDVAPALHPQLRAACGAIAPGKSAERYLSSTADDKFLSRVWRSFWFNWVATPDVLLPWVRSDKAYAPPNAFTRIQRDDGAGCSQIFEGRAGSLKATIAELVQSGSATEAQGWRMLAEGIPQSSGQKKQGVADRAHSYREDLDSALSQLGWIAPDGRPTDEGYRYTNICERYGGANSAAAVEYLGGTLLQTGHYGTFLHYINRLSEQCFSANPLAFTSNTSGTPVFNEQSYSDYLKYLEDELSDNLKVMRKVSTRGRPRRRTPFQAELTLLRNYGFVSATRYRLGVGIPIDWEKVLGSLNVQL